jgi:hypothetical protein
MLDLEQINLLDNGAKERYMLLEKLFDHAGFKYLLEWAKAQVVDATNREMNATNWEQVCFFRGARLAYANFANIEDFSEREFAEIAQNALEAKFEAEQEQLEADGE